MSMDHVNALYHAKNELSIGMNETNKCPICGATRNTAEHKRIGRKCSRQMQRLHAEDRRHAA